VWSRRRSRGFAGLGSGRSGAVGCCTSLLYCWLPRPRCLVELTASSSRIRSTVCAGLGQLVYVLVAVGLRRLGQHRITRSSPRFPRRSRHGGHAERLPPAGLPVAQAPPCHAARPGRHDGRTATRPRTLLSRPRGMVAFGARRGGRPTVTFPASRSARRRHQAVRSSHGGPHRRSAAPHVGYVSGSRSVWRDQPEACLGQTGIGQKPYYVRY
jgi:hypothetical protein